MLQSVKAWFQAQFKGTKINNKDLALFTLSVYHDSKESRLVVNYNGEIGLDLPGDSLEKMLEKLFNGVTGGELELGKA